MITFRWWRVSGTCWSQQRNRWVDVLWWCFEANAALWWWSCGQSATEAKGEHHRHVLHQPYGIQHRRVWLLLALDDHCAHLQHTRTGCLHLHRQPRLFAVYTVQFCVHSKQANNWQNLIAILCFSFSSRNWSNCLWHTRASWSGPFAGDALHASEAHCRHGGNSVQLCQ